MSDNELIVTLPGKKVVVANYNGHTITTDQPLSNGGDNTAPSPYDLFLASIGTCAGIFVAGFCQNRNISTDNIKIVQKINWNETTHVVDNIDINIHVPPDFPEKYHEALVKVASQCSVKKTIAAQPTFNVKTVVN